MKPAPFKSRDFWTEPFKGFEGVENEMQRVFSLLSRWMGRRPGWFEKEFGPAIDVYDSKNDIVVEVDIPGMNKDEIDVSIEGDSLTVRGEKKKESEVKEENYIKSERFYGSFIRTIPLPSAIDKEKVNASYKNGVLQLRLPKKEEARTKHIAVEVK